MNKLTPAERAKHFRVERHVEKGTSYRYRVITTFNVRQDSEDVEGYGLVTYNPPYNRGKVTCCRATLKRDCQKSLDSGKYDWMVGLKMPARTEGK